MTPAQGPHRPSRRPPEPRRSTTTGPTGSRYPARDEVDTVVTGVSRRRRAVRARRRARAPSSCSSTTACSGRARRGALDAAAHAPPAAALRRTTWPRRLPPAARRPPRGRQQRAARRRRSARRPRAVRARSAIGVAARFAGDGIAADELVARVRDADRAASRSPSPPGPSAVRTIGDRLRRRPRTTSTTRSPRASTRSSPASRASASMTTRARPASTSSPPATTPPRPSACARSATCWPSGSGVRHVFVDVPNPI